MIFLLAVMLFNPTAELEIVQDKLNEELPAHQWNCREIGNGNINFIYLADDGERHVIVKKALDFARINPEEFPLPVERLLYEYRALTFYERLVPDFVPKIYFFDLDQGMLAMEYLTPHIILRKGLIEGNQYPLVGKHLGQFLAKTLYFTSRHYLPEDEWGRNVSLFCSNTAMRQIILDLNYTDPFYGSPLNGWTTPELDDIVSEIQTDPQIKAVVDELKRKFLYCPEALSHGDLHTGSILVTATDTRVFDTEFASYAPISFDIGTLLSNFAMAAIAMDSPWLAATTREIWDEFAIHFPKPELLEAIWADTLKLMGMEIARRIIGVAHNADFETIADRTIKAKKERKALELAKELLLGDPLPNSKTLEERLL